MICLYVRKVAHMPGYSDVYVKIIILKITVIVDIMNISYVISLITHWSNTNISSRKGLSE